MADFLEFDGGFAPDIDTMDREELQACLKEVRERIADLDEREPADMNSEEYEAWGDRHEEATRPIGADGIPFYSPLWAV